MADRLRTAWREKNWIRIPRAGCRTENARSSSATTALADGRWSKRWTPSGSSAAINGMTVVVSIEQSLSAHSPFSDRGDWLPASGNLQWPLGVYSVGKLDSDVAPPEVWLRVASRARRIDRPQSHAEARKRDFDRDWSRGTRTKCRRRI